MTGRVVHVKDNVPGAVYIGRLAGKMPRSVWANPYSVKRHGREEAITRYANRLTRSPDLIRQLPALRGQPLACWCRRDGADKTDDTACHGDILLAWLTCYTDSELHLIANVTERLQSDTLETI